MHRTRWAQTAVALVLILSFRASTVFANESGESLGKSLFVQCSGCHWETGEGSEALGAPNLTMLDGAYLRRQLAQFRNGTRGAHPKDTYGIQMALFAKALRSAENDQAVIQYLETLPDVPPDNAAGAGEPEAGKHLFQTCAACHGQQAEGIAALGAPRLTGLQAWYIERQLVHYRTGIRPSTQGDAYALQMAAAAQTLSDAQAIRNVVAYITTLALPKSDQL